MRFRSFLCCLVVVALLVFLIGKLTPTQASAAAKSGELLRLHIVAHSDSAGDQEMKLRVRDEVLAEFEQDFGSVKTLAEARKVVEASQARIVAAARRAGFEGKVSVQVGEFDFPDRVYGDTLVPAGRYQALRIVLGDGAGQNWWCVMYPPLCFTSEDGLVTAVEDVEFRSFFAELWQKLMQKNRAKEVSE